MAALRYVNVSLSSVAYNFVRMSM